ncbi:MAG: 3-oxoacyl-[acyl-carrier-protein] synthase-3 [Bacteroidia bacterium]|jgi:3-oxoacyl-[acyl-carrier-protein] synthase-3
MVSEIKAISYYLPEDVLSNQALVEQFPEWSIQKIEDKTGIKQRHISADDELASDMAVKAAEKLFEEYAIDRSIIDFVILCTQSPDYYLPTTACIIQNKLGLSTSTGAFDINLGCSGFVYSLGICRGLIESNQAKNILLLTSETYSKFIDPRDKSIRTLFGDAACATLVSAADGSSKIENFVYGTDGAGAEHLIVKRNSLRINDHAKTEEMIEDEYGNKRKMGDLFMNGAEVFNFSIKSVPVLIKQTLEKNNMEMEDVDYFVLHQPNKFMLDGLQRRSKIPKEKFLTYYEQCGNTVSSTIPIVLKESMKSGILKKGNRVLLAGFGVGYSWAGCILTL